MNGSSRRVSGGGSVDRVEVNTEADGLIGGTWRLCAAKRMAADRDSQTMGLREAFFLGRLTNSAGATKSRALSPLRHSTQNRTRRNASVYIIKLIAVKEEKETGRRGSHHGRTVSDLKVDKAMLRQRSSTFIPMLRRDSESLSSLSFSSSSLPALAQTAKAVPSTPSLSRWIILLEHAPLGTMDRLLRTSPYLVGRRLWERWAMEGADALEWVHSKGVVQADVKPGNILVHDDTGLC